MNLTKTELIFLELFKDYSIVKTADSHGYEVTKKGAKVKQSELVAKVKDYQDAIIEELKKVK